MREQPHYTNLLTADFFSKYYVKKHMSFPKIRKMLFNHGYNIHVGTLHAYAKRLGFGRTISEAKRKNLEENPLDWAQAVITEEVIEAIDGFILGDGSISVNKNMTAGRLRCDVEHVGFCAYMMEFFKDYGSSVSRVNDDSMRQGYYWAGNTLHHPDLAKQYLRWYPETNEKRDKQPPDNVRITPTSVMLWYLGDGSVVQTGNSIAIRISTDSFLPERVEFLASKLKEKKIDCHRNNDNRIYIEAKGITAFFKFIGNKSPIKCYDYKFELPEWRLESKRMKQVADELGVDYQRLAYLVKIGKVKAYRASENGKPRFMPEHIEEIKRMLVAGEI